MPWLTFASRATLFIVSPEYPSRARHRMVARTMGDKPSGIYIVPETQFPAVHDGGCSVINFFYDVAEDSLISLQCNGEA